MARVKIKQNVLLQQDRRVRLPDHLSIFKPGETNFDIFVDGDEIIFKKSPTQKENNYKNRQARQKGEK